MKILLVKTSSMGDLVHTLPAVTDIARAYPDAQIDWLAERPFDSIARLHPAVHNVITVAWRKWRKSFWRAETRHQMYDFWQQLRAEKYDVVIDFQGLVKSAVMTRIARRSGSPSIKYADMQPHFGYCGYDKESVRESPASIAYNHCFEISFKKTSVVRNRELAAASLDYQLDGQVDFGLHHLPLLDDWSFLARNVGAQIQTPWVALIHGASRDEKLWDFNNWVQLISHLASQGQRTLLLWGSDQERVRSEQLYDAAVAAQVPNNLLPIAPPFLTITQVAQCLAVSTAVVGLDSGFTHLAGALNRPTVGIYADFDPQLAALMGVNYCVGLGGIGMPPTVETVIQQLAWAQQFDSEHRHHWLNGVSPDIAISPMSQPQAVLHHMRFKA